jgi:Flp pilus assembly pilin Flp
MQAFKRRLAGFTGLEWIVIVAIIAVLIALLYPQTQWVSDGSIRLPVRVIVIDAEQGTPISGAKVLVSRGPWAKDPKALDELRDRFASGFIDDLPQKYFATTDEKGVAVIEHEFFTSASDRRPVSHAHLDYNWVRVEAEGYRAAFVPVRDESQPTALLRKQGEVLVQIEMIEIGR